MAESVDFWWYSSVENNIKYITNYINLYEKTHSKCVSRMLRYYDFLSEGNVVA